MTVIALDSAAREHAWALLTTVDGTVIEQQEMAGGELDRRLPGVIAGFPLGEVTAVVVLTGPGSYSGVRAAMAAALGFAAARSLPLHGLGNLAAIAVAVTAAVGAEFTVVADAGRGGVYAARFARGAAGTDQLSPVQRLSADEVDSAATLYATSEIAGLRVEPLEPVRTLAAAVPHALALPPLEPVGLTAIHAQ
ncbi:MAG: tRNA (adenosine(37)-N6)-threonylcarbamoyltransferase complex dimerization subunit type 1 TsaB [Candidatus Dormibacteraeota bacterium]|nr:tRNA (adenosine(37)-N6)-threonylcarbamoyltransferase complex dimerization subunit type 1 TsaB [Candidatus Dormibacteraeota bacterium]